MSKNSLNCVYHSYSFLSPALPPSLKAATGAQQSGKNNPKTAKKLHGVLPVSTLTCAFKRIACEPFGNPVNIPSVVINAYKFCQQCDLNSTVINRKIVAPGFPQTAIKIPYSTQLKCSTSNSCDRVGHFVNFGLLKQHLGIKVVDPFSLSM